MQISGSGLTLTNANTFNGITSTSGFLQLANSNALQNSTLNSMSKVSFSPSIGTFTVGGLSVNGINALILNDTSGAPITLRVGNNNNNTTVQGVNGSGSMVKIGTGTLTMSNCFYSGTTTIDAGSIELAWPFLSDLPYTTVVLNVNNGLLFGHDSGAVDHNYDVGGLSGSCNFALANVNGGYIRLYIGKNNSDTTYSGTMSGVGTLLKEGTGTSTLSGANTYSGWTEVVSGTLRVTGSLVASGSGNVIVWRGSDFTTASVVQRVGPEMSFAGVGSRDNYSSKIGADIRVGQNNSAAAVDLSMQWRTRNRSETPVDTTASISPSAGLHGLVSDVLNLIGMSSPTGNPDEADPFALQFAYGIASNNVSLSALLGGNEADLAAEGALFSDRSTQA